MEYDRFRCSSNLLRKHRIAGYVPRDYRYENRKQLKWLRLHDPQGNIVFLHFSLGLHFEGEVALIQNQYMLRSYLVILDEVNIK